jgi:V8-like Glu-specific endopeptidase
LWGHTNSSCTAWLISNGAALTAGHCVDLDPDGSGPQLPDGVADLNGVMEFNVPASDASGNVVMAAPQDQFPINTSSFVWHYDGEGQGIGKDYGILLVNANTGTGERPHVGRGFYRLSQSVPSAGTTIRITGFGADSGTTNFTNQTSTGPYVGQSSSGSQVWHEYQVDTMGGNSGSPILNTANGFTLGIHTNGGCAADGTGANSGTSFNHTPLSNAVNVFPATNIRYVDNVTYPGAPLDTGVIFAPFHSVINAVTSVPAGGVISVVEGTYNDGAQTINKALTLVAPVGDVVIR